MTIGLIWTTVLVLLITPQSWVDQLRRRANQRKLRQATAKLADPFQYFYDRRDI